MKQVPDSYWVQTVWRSCKNLKFDLQFLRCMIRALQVGVGVTDSVDNSYIKNRLKTTDKSRRYDQLMRIWCCHVSKMGAQTSKSESSWLSRSARRSRQSGRTWRARCAWVSRGSRRPCRAKLSEAWWTRKTSGSRLTSKTRSAGKSNRTGRTC